MTDPNDAKVNPIPGIENEDSALEDLPSDWREEDRQIDGKKPALDEIEDDEGGL